MWQMIPGGGERKVTIAVRPALDQQARKITKIIGLNGEGFSVLVPYHQARSGFVCKMPIDPRVQKPGEHFIPWDDCVGFTAEDRVKLSYHTDGFAQFSGERPGRITSGRDPITGEPKSLGLMTHPLTSPVWSGPSVGVTVWGIEEFDEVEENDGPLMIFEPDEFYYRGCGPDEGNGWMLHIYAFPVNVIPPVRFNRGYAVVDVAIQPLNGALVAIVQQKMIYLREEKVFLGLFVNSVIVDFPSKSGWNLNGPGDFTLTKAGHVLMAGYPREKIPVEGRDSIGNNILDIPGLGGLRLGRRDRLSNQRSQLWFASDHDHEHEAVWIVRVSLWYLLTARKERGPAGSTNILIVESFHE